MGRYKRQLMRRRVNLDSASPSPSASSCVSGSRELRHSARAPAAARRDAAAGRRAGPVPLALFLQHCQVSGPASYRGGEVHLAGRNEQKANTHNHFCDFTLFSFSFLQSLFSYCVVFAKVILFAGEEVNKNREQNSEGRGEDERSKLSTTRRQAKTLILIEC